MDARPSELTLHLERSLHAPASLVYAACTEPDLLAEWWGPNGFTTPGIEIDVRVGGRYRIAMQPPEGELFYLNGEFLEVDPPTRLAYTFRWEDPDADDQETVVTISLRDAGESMEFIVDQGPFATEARHDLHHAGWTESLVRLEGVLKLRAG